MFGRTPSWRHLLVAVTIAIVTALALAGVLGDPVVEEHIASLQVTISPTSDDRLDDGLVVREVIDQEFGDKGKHGPELVVPDDFGPPTDVRVQSETAPDDVDVRAVGRGTRVRVGDPNETIEGMHRYVLSYTLPDAQLRSRTLAIDAVGADSDIAIEGVEVLITGLELTDTACYLGSTGSRASCDLATTADGYRVSVDRLEPGEGITVEGRITSRATPATPEPPPFPDAPPDRRALWTVLVAGLGTATVVPTYRWARRVGSNDVAGHDAADAAFGGTGPAGHTLIRQVTDEELAELATIEFAPPPGIEPWQGALVLSERLDDDVIGAWFSTLAAHDVVEIENRAGKVVLSPGPRAGEADLKTGEILGQLFPDGGERVLDGYDEDFAKVWSKVGSAQREWSAESGWWRSHPPGSSGALRHAVGFAGLALLIAFVTATIAGVALAATDSIVAWGAAVLVAIGVPGLVARIVYAPLLPGRSVTGSGLALRTESFRRFLEGSEGRHVEWAWEHGLLREYSAWAVALDTADAWRKAMERSSVAPAEYNVRGPLMVHALNRSFQQAHVKPSSSSSGVSGGGGVGGGGGGGSHGSW